MSDDYPPWQERLVVAVERIADGIEQIEGRMATERLARVTAARPNRPNRSRSEAKENAKCVWCGRSWRLCVNYPCQGRQNQSDGSGR